jgi:hypothetical protein
MAVLGPNSFIAGEAGQEMYVRVFNFSGAPGTWTLSAEGPSLDGPWSCEVTITGSKGPRDLATQVVGIPLGQNPEAGDSHIDIEFTNADGVHGPRAEWVKVIDLAGWQRVIILAGARFGLIDDDPLAVEQLIWVLTRGDSSAPLDITAPRPASWLGASGPAYKGASLAITGIVAAGLLAFGSALRGRRRMAREVRMAGGDR